ncbi:tRNA (5-methylaminomethyl-2-thiouridine)(34)-methyltransferase MnmD [Synechococcus sp. BDU 130192]|uniref:tRNA (5-methylaminomethyl-2-thiouridine)(34)-methyltransferase MnmD n=1 Tax=Synechococcus sp. BDU 130192 TaxID=2042059 RepID=UPI000C07070A|nr:MnmC family methyltransferase [Synechococcus sp. BDU 130192]
MSSLVPQLTADGSYTFFSEEFQEHFHSQVGAKREAKEKFLLPCRIAELAQQPQLRLLDVCYGLGHNTAAALTEIWRVNPHCQVTLFALEKDQAIALDSIQQNILAAYPETVVSLLWELSENLQVETGRFKAQLLTGDARQTIQRVIQANFQADAIFLDPFSPPKCPQLWTVEFLNLVAQCLASDGYLATYSCAAAVRVALQAAGLKLGKTPGVGRKSPGTLARFIPENLTPLSQQEQEHLLTNAAIAYRDPTLQDDAATILQRRRDEQKSSQRESTSHWKKRWLALNSTVPENDAHSPTTK